jgi:hypothetical protein
MGLRKCALMPWTHSILNLKTGLVFCYGALGVCLLAAWLFQSRSESVVDTTGWQFRDFCEHLQKRGVHVHVHCGDSRFCVYLTEDPKLTWEAIQVKTMVPECIDQWQGTVRLGYWSDWNLPQGWGKHCRRIGAFELIGDEKLIRRIQEACQSGTDD